ncbi:uncharacterized protein LOC110108379 [Dendrobium catenatum]|uniref:uncharacterized protein LOC110108379 n=1 Tax=Dendrobium catenatum TaxID=906689 RepID=UPI0009F30F03|nr:uncharacterized protein LOC110108379 [Dendrobium catenatum]
MVRHLARIASNHCPVMLRISSPIAHKNCNLRFKDTWLSFPASQSVVWFAWNKPSGGNADTILNNKFRRSLKALFFWNKAKHKSLTELKISLKKDILELQEEESSTGGISDQKIDLLRSRVRDLNATLGRLCTWWKQRSKMRWLKDGDSNSKFFHASATVRRNINWINHIKNDAGLLIENQDEITEVFLNFFKNKWRSRVCSLDDWPPCSKAIVAVDFIMLDRDFS